MEKVRCFNDHLCLHWESDDLMWNCWPVSQCACKWPLLGNDLQSLITWLISCYSLSADCCQCANLMITWSDISRPQMLMCLNPWLLLRLAPGPSSNVVFGENEAMAGDWLWSLLVIRAQLRDWDISLGPELCHWDEEMDRGNQFMSYPCHDNSII